VRELSEIPDMPGGLVRRAGEHLVAAISAALEGDISSLRSQIGPSPLSGAQRQLLGALSERLDVVATELGIAPAILMPKADLEHLIRQQSDISIMSPATWSGWRGEVVVDPLRHWLSEATA
jgi:ribonuclease D